MGRGQTDTQTDKQTDSVTTRPTRPREHFEKILCYQCMFFLGFFLNCFWQNNVKDIHIEEKRNDSSDKKKPITSLKLRIKYNILNMLRNLYLNQLLTMIFLVNTQTPLRVKNKIVLFVKRNSSQIIIWKLMIYKITWKMEC